MLTANTKELLRLITNNENARRFDLGNWVRKDSCGTYGCLVGNDQIATNYPNEDIDTIEKNMDEFDIPLCACDKKAWEDAGAYGLQNRTFGWLFHITEIQSNGKTGSSRKQYDKEAAINRVRKLVYYILHKREMMIGGTPEYEKAKEIGHAGVSEKVLEYV